MGSVAVLALVVLGVFFLVKSYNTSGANNPKRVAGRGLGAESKFECQIIEYGSGVYYFDGIEADFANALSHFRSQHPELIQTAMTGDGTGGYGSDTGYFVTFESRTPGTRLPE